MKATIKTLYSYLSRKRFLAAMVIAAIAALPVLIVLDQQSTTYLDGKRANLQQEQARLLSALNSTPSPQDMVPGTINSQARYVVSSTEDSAQRVNAAAVDLGFSFFDRLVAFFSRSYSIYEMTRLNKQMGSAAADVVSELNRYSRTLSAMLDFVEYNPSIDTTDLDLDSEEGSERLSRLRAGLEKASDSLERIENDPLSEKAFLLVERARVLQLELESSGKTEEFASSFEALQAEFIGLADEHRQSLVTSLRSTVIEIARQIGG